MTPLAPLELLTPRLKLRQFRPDDWDAFATTAADPEVMRFIGDGSTQSREDTWRAMAAFLGHWALLGYGMWALQRRDDGRFAGRAGFLDRPGWPGFELGWVLAREQWGQGLAQEAARAALAVAFDVLKRPAVISLIRPDNERSKRVARALGERHVETIDLLGSPAEKWRIEAPWPSRRMLADHPPYQKFAVRVARSAIDGFGVFAAEPIPPRRKIGEIRGESIPVAEARRRAAGQRRIMIVEVSMRRAIDASKSTDPMRFTNHSCAANARLAIRDGRVEFYALRDIAVGEEVTVNYGETHHEGRLQCRCGAAGCIGRL